MEWSDATKMKYGKATNRLNELHEHLPLAGKQLNITINSIASWANRYTVTNEINLTKDLMRLKEKWETLIIK